MPQPNKLQALHALAGQLSAMRSLPPAQRDRCPRCQCSAPSETHLLSEIETVENKINNHFRRSRSSRPVESVDDGKDDAEPIEASAHQDDD